MTWAPTHCATCNDTGYQPAGKWCTCDGRPFPLDGSEPAPPTGTCRVLTRAEDARERITAESQHADATTAIDELMTWTRSVLAPVIALGTLAAYEERGALDVVAPRVLQCLDALEARLDSGAEIIRRTRAVALDALGEGEVV